MDNRKGVICKVCEPEEMPVDEAGNRADIVMDPNATVSRMNLGRLYEQYINAGARDVVKRIRAILGQRREKDFVDVANIEEAKVDEAWNMLMAFYEAVSDIMPSWFQNGTYRKTRNEHLNYILKEGIYLYFPPENQKETVDIVKAIEAQFPPTYGPVSYVGNSGNRVTTRNKVRIGSMYILLLEKTGDDWNAVSSGALQHFGVLAPIPKSFRHTKPARTQAIRAWGEAEVRIGVSYVGTDLMADIMDRNNSTATHEAVIESILDAEHPTNIHNTVDRTKIPLGNSRPLQIVKHLAECAGWRFVYKKDGSSTPPPARMSKSIKE